MAAALLRSGVRLHCDASTGPIARDALSSLQPPPPPTTPPSTAAAPWVVDAVDGDFGREWLSLDISVRVVQSAAEAVGWINAHGSHHTDAIVTGDAAAAQTFLATVDSAGVYHNASTRFADGFRYGFGAEVGISTNRIHARGPVGLEGLMTYKYTLVGGGQVVAQFAGGSGSGKAAVTTPAGEQLPALAYTHRDRPAGGAFE